MTVWGITPRGCFPGVSRVWEEGQKVCPEFKWVHLEDLKPHPDDPLLFGAWSQGYSLPLRRHPGPKYVLWSSPPLQSELDEGELGYLEMLMGMKQRGLLADIIHLDKDSAGILPGLHFPAPFVVPEGVKPVSPEDREGAALFCPPHFRKNFFTQALGAKAAGLRLHLNGANAYHGILRSAGVEFQNHGWFPTWRDMLNELARKQVSLCAFLSESHCYSAHESLALGVPIIASGVVAENMGLKREEAVLSVDNPVEISARISAILSDYATESRRAKEVAETTANRHNEGFKAAIRLIQDG